MKKALPITQQSLFIETLLLLKENYLT